MKFYGYHLQARKDKPYKGRLLANMANLNKNVWDKHYSLVSVTSLK